MDGSTHPLIVLGELLKRPGRILHELKHGRFRSVFLALLVIAGVSFTIYGLVVGSLTGGAQYWFAPAKIILGTALTVLICLPSLYIFLCLGGADVHVRDVAGELMASVALTGLLLLGFAPVAWVFSQSTNSVAAMGALHLILWGVALGFGLPLVGRNQQKDGRTLGGVTIWIMIYLVVSLQMMTSLRPIIAPASTVLPSAGIEKKFLLDHILQTLNGDGAKTDGARGEAR